MKFEWDESKARSNAVKHDVEFREAQGVFDDPLAAIFDDEGHSDVERREIIIGYSRQYRLLLVSFTEREDAVRIISARLATRKERRTYEERAF